MSGLFLSGYEVILSTKEGTEKIQSDLELHGNVLKMLVIENIENNNLQDATTAYKELLCLNDKRSVAKDLLSLGIQLVEKTMPQHTIQSQITLLLRQLIAMKGHYLEKHVKHLAKIYLLEGNCTEARAIIKSKLCHEKGKKLLEDLCLDPSSN